MSLFIISLFCIGASIGLALPFLFSISLYTKIFYIGLLSLSAIYIGYKKKESIFLFVFLPGLLLGDFRSTTFIGSHTSILSEYYNKEIQLEGRVSEMPDTREDYVYLYIDNIQLGEHEGAHIRERLLIKTQMYPEFVYGDILKVNGKIRPPLEPFSLLEKSRFSYKDYLSASDVFAVMYTPHIEKTGRDTNILLEGLYAFRESCSNTIKSLLPAPQSSLLLGVLFGEKHALPKDITEFFLHAGVIHIVVLSGYNVALVIEWITKLLFFVPYRMRFFLTCGGIVAFVLMVGAGSTAVRAGIMAGIALFARVLGRQSHGVQALCIAALLMGLFEPRILLFDPSFALSFLATLGLILWTPILEHSLRSVTVFMGLRTILASTIATQLTVIPFLLFYMGTFSGIGILSNIVVVPLVPIAMGLGVLLLLVSFLPPLAFIVGYALYIVLSLILSIAEVFGGHEFVMISFSIGVLPLVFIYALQGVLLFQMRHLVPREEYYDTHKEKYAGN